jgi:hypothetical protein
MRALTYKLAEDCVFAIQMLARSVNKNFFNVKVTSKIKCDFNLNSFCCINIGILWQICLKTKEFREFGVA